LGERLSVSLQWPAADIRRPEVYNWFKEKLNANVRVGVKGYKIDRGEENEMPDSAENQLSVLVTAIFDPLSLTACQAPAS
jgi:alpha-glucosidase (family GH31 glycosyl hydrolase)